MSQSMLVAAAVIEDGREIDWAAAEDAARAFDVAGLDAEEISQLSNWLLDLDDLTGDPVADAAVIAGLREVLLSDVRELRQAIDGDSGQITWITVRGARIWLSGGPSWGDSPTEMFDVLVRLSETAVLAAAGFEVEAD